MLIKVKVFPSAKEEIIIDRGKTIFEIRVKEKPVKGLVNKRLIKLLSKHLHIPQTDIVLIKGKTTREKIFKVN